MRNLRKLTAAISCLICLTAIPLVHSQVAAAQTVSPPTALDFGKLPAITSLTLSPDGKHMAAITSSDGKLARLSIWDTSDFSKPPFVIASDPRVRFMSVSFVKNERLAVTLRQQVDEDGYLGHIFRAEFTDLTGSKWFKGVPDRVLGADSTYAKGAILTADVVASLPNDPENVLVQGYGGAIYKTNLVTGKISFWDRLDAKEGSPVFTVDGEMRAKTRFVLGQADDYVVQLIKNPETKVWEEHFRAYIREREIPRVVALTSDPNIILVNARRGKDHTVIYNYDIKKREFLDIAFEHPVFDAGSVSIDPQNNEVRAFSYDGDRPMAYYVDEGLDSTMSGISNALGVKTKLVKWKDLATGKLMSVRIPDGADVSLVDATHDFKTLIISKSGSAEPQSYYLYHEGHPLQLLGESTPWIKPDLFADGQLVQYTARDGRSIPAFVFKPKAEVYGAGPYPTIIIPHGGPWARDYNDDVDPWVQYYVAKGYAVAKPQYRGSEGWGWDQWSAGDNKWGYEMSDDMDDVALGMVKDGIADRSRLMMHGYSFGGYSAMAAIVRPDPIYTCAISGAGPDSPVSMQRETRDGLFTRQFQRPFVGGLNAREHVKEASIPILIYHGDRDTNVDPRESKLYYDALMSAGKRVDRKVFKDMGHTYTTWNPEHMSDLLTTMDAFIETDCKMQPKK